MKPPNGVRGAQIMAIVRELTGSGATRRQIAARAGTSAGHVSQAIRLLLDAPDLAGQVERGQIGITAAYRALCERRFRQLTTAPARPASPRPRGSRSPQS